MVFKIVIRYVIIFSLLIHFISCGCKEPTGRRLIDSDRKINAYIITDDDIKKYIRDKNGIDDDNIGESYKYIMKTAMIICSASEQNMYVIKNNGEVIIKENYLQDIGKSFYINSKYEIINYDDPSVGNEWKVLFFPIFDRDSRFLAICYEKKDSKKEIKSRIYNISSKEVVYESSGSINLLQSKGNIIYFIPSSSKGDFKINLIKYDVNKKKVIDIIEIQYPKNFNSQMNFFENDIDVDNELISFYAKYHSGRLFFQKSLRNKVWIYSYKENSYIYDKTFENDCWSAYVFFLPCPDMFSHNKK